MRSFMRSSEVINHEIKDRSIKSVINMSANIFNKYFHCHQQRNEIEKVIGRNLSRKPQAQKKFVKVKR
jgi:hypothetical protein